VWACVVFNISSNLGSICENPHLPRKAYSLFAMFGFNHGHAGDNPVSHKYDTAEALFQPKLGFCHSMKIKNLSDFLN